MSDLNINVQLRAFDRMSRQFANIRQASDKLTRKFDQARGKLGALNQHLKDVEAMRKHRAALAQNGQALTEMRERARRSRTRLYD
ncbi:hypothetical protein [Rappaport israeli]|uniref:hypothetical protein n=1 Tax=Rappaport israeli TaxID=1839807 RepID=UPI0009318FFD|nr:hypothetical protein [Rappaport israeli]